MSTSGHQGAIRGFRVHDAVDFRSATDILGSRNMVRDAVRTKSNSSRHRNFLIRKTDDVNEKRGVNQYCP